MFINQKVDIVEAYTLARENIPVGTVIPVTFGENKEPSGGLITGYIFKNIRKNPKKFAFWDVCLPIVFCGKQKFVCSLDEECGKLLGISNLIDTFKIESWKNNDFIVENGAI